MDDDKAYFRNQYPTLAALVNSLSNHYIFGRLTTDDNQLIENAIKYYGSLAQMPSGYWLSPRRTLILYVNLIISINLQYAQSLIGKIFTTPSLLKECPRYIRELLRAATKETLIACLEENEPLINMIFEGRIEISQLWIYLDDAGKTVLTKELLRIKGKILPSICLFSNLERILETDHVIRHYILRELLTPQGEDFPRIITSIDDFKAILYHFPQHKSELVTIADTQEKGLLGFAHSMHEIYTLLTICPEKEEAIKQNFLRTQSGVFRRCMNECNDLMRVIVLFQEEDTIINMARSNEGGLTKLLQPIDQFIEFCKRKNTLAKKIVKLQQTEGHSIFFILIKNGENFSDLLNQFPEYTEVFKTILLEKMAIPNITNFIGTLSNLSLMIQHFPDLKEELIGTYFNRLNEAGIDKYGLYDAAIKYPISTKLIWSYIQAQPWLYAIFIESSKEFFRIEQCLSKTKDSCQNSIATNHHSENSRTFLPFFATLKLKRHQRNLLQSPYVFARSPNPYPLKSDLNFTLVVPLKFKGLLQMNTSQVLTTCSHASKDGIHYILRDGIIYSRKESHFLGLGCEFDERREDGKLVFTSTYGNYKGDVITFSVPALCAIQRPHNNHCKVVFKFYDWSTRDSSGELHLTDKIDLCFNFPPFDEGHNTKEYMTFSFKNADKKIQGANVNVPLPEGMYYGYIGLNNYLRYFIFRVIEGLPEEHGWLKSEIYNEFEKKSLSELHEFLTQFAKKLFAYSELDFMGRVHLDHAMIKSVTIDEKTTDFDLIRSAIRKGDIQSLRGMIQKKSVFELVSKSFFLVKGLAQYAEQMMEPRIAQFLRRSFHEVLEIEHISTRRDLLDSFSQETLDYVYSTLSQPYSNAEDCSNYVPAQKHLNMIVHRPNHGTVHTLRVCAMTPFVLRAIGDYGIESYQVQAKEADCRKIMHAALFLVLGRENENGFSDNKDEYLAFRQTSGTLFDQFFASRDEFTHDELGHYQDCIIELGNPNRRSLIDIVLNIAHKSNLGRCFNSRAMSAHVTYLEMFFKKEHAPHIAMALLSYATRMQEVTGDRILTSFNALTFTREDYQADRFVTLSQRAEFNHLVEVLASVPQPLLPSLSDQSVDGITELNFIENDLKVSYSSSVYYSISPDHRVALLNLTESSKGFFGFLYAGTRNHSVSFAYNLLNHGDRISKDVLEKLKQRYPHWNSNFNDSLIPIVDSIEQKSDVEVTTNQVNSHNYH